MESFTRAFTPVKPRHELSQNASGTATEDSTVEAIALSAYATQDAGREYRPAFFDW